MTDNSTLVKMLKNLGSIKGFENLITEVLKSVPLENQYYVNQLLEEINNDKETVIGKDSVKSTMLRQKGNELYKKSETIDEYCRVFKTYNESVAFAPNKSEELALGYANRAMVLFRLKYYKECLADINRALCANVPDKTVEKLLVKRVRCMKNINHQDLHIIYKDSLEWIDKHEDNNSKRAKELKADVKKAFENKAEPSASFNVKFRDDLLAEMKKRCPNLDKVEIGRVNRDELALVAARDIQTGEVVAIQKMYIQIFDLEKSYLTCCQCLVMCLNPIPCGSCTLAVFCSESCKAEAWNKHHEFECPIMDFIKGFMRDYMLPIRICMYALKQIGGILPLMKEVYKMSKRDDMKKEHRIVNGVYQSESYRNVYYMTKKSPIEDMNHGMEALKVCEFVYFIATHTTLFNKQYQGRMFDVMNEKLPKFFAALILRHFVMLNGDYSTFTTSVSPLFHFMSHSCCSPNSFIIPLKDHQVVIAIDQIKKGEVLTFSSTSKIVAGLSTGRKQNYLPCDMGLPPFNVLENDQEKLRKLWTIKNHLDQTIFKHKLRSPKTTREYAQQTSELFENVRPFFAMAPRLCQDVIELKNYLVTYHFQLYNNIYAFDDSVPRRRYFNPRMCLDV